MGFNPLEWNSDDWLDFGTNFATGGLVGWENGGFTPGLQFDAAGRVVGEVTGTAAMTRALEEEMRRAEARAVEERENIRTMREQEMMLREREDRAASARAGSLRGRDASSSIHEGNFLGL